MVHKICRLHIYLTYFQKLRNKFVFKIVPMINPDGVIVGNYRCSLAARDLNRNYRHPRRESFPTIWCLKNMVYELARKHQVIKVYHLMWMSVVQKFQSCKTGSCANILTDNGEYLVLKHSTNGYSVTFVTASSICMCYLSATSYHFNSEKKTRK